MPVSARPHHYGPGLIAAVRRGDQRALSRLGATDHGRLRPLLRATARAADLLMPWAAFSLWLLADGRPGARSALVRGWTALVAAAAIDNGVLKPAVGRGRPDPQCLPRGERRRSNPSTSAFPSGHTGASTAFCVAVARDVRALAPGLALTLLAVVYAELYTGRHHPSDALVGGAIGAVVGYLIHDLHSAA